MKLEDYDQVRDLMGERVSLKSDLRSLRELKDRVGENGKVEVRLSPTQRDDGWVRIVLPVTEVCDFVRERIVQRGEQIDIELQALGVEFSTSRGRPARAAPDYDATRAVPGGACAPRTRHRSKHDQEQLSATTKTAPRISEK